MSGTDNDRFGPCPTRLDNQPTPSARPWRYGHAASLGGVHWDIYAGEGIDGWLVGMVTTEADAALIVQAVNAQPAAPAEGLTCPSCGGEGWVVTADPNKFGEPGEPYQVLCPNSIFHERAAPAEGLRVAAQPILDRALDVFDPDDLDPESSLAMPVTLKARWVYALRAALDAS